jgi:predicted transcriptional regulator
MSELNFEAMDATRHIVCSYVANNPVSPADLPGLIGSVYSAMGGLGGTAPAAALAPPQPAVSVRSSVTADRITCLHCALKFKSLKRHLMTRHSQTPEQYREMFGLKPDYPMTSTNYSAVRSGLAKQSGLGRVKMPAKPRR